MEKVDDICQNHNSRNSISKNTNKGKSDSKGGDWVREIVTENIMEHIGENEEKNRKNSNQKS